MRRAVAPLSWYNRDLIDRDLAISSPNTDFPHENQHEEERTGLRMPLVNSGGNLENGKKPSNSKPTAIQN
jgi:hypothetical protein